MCNECNVMWLIIRNIKHIHYRLTAIATGSETGLGTILALNGSVLLEHCQTKLQPLVQEARS